MCEGFPSPSSLVAANSLPPSPLPLPSSSTPLPRSLFITSRALTPSLFSLLSRSVSFPRFAQQAQPRIPPTSTPLRVYISGVFIRDRAFFVLVVTEPWVSSVKEVDCRRSRSRRVRQDGVHHATR